MRLVRLLPERWQKLIREAFKFGVVGGLNTIVNFAVFNALILTLFTDGQLKANVAATVVATTTSYFMNRHWTYRDRPKALIRREYTLFFAFNGAGLLIELAVMGAAKYGFGLTSLVALNVAKATGVGLGTIFRFWAYRTFVFKAAPPSEVPSADATGLAAGVVAPQPVAVAPQPRSGRASGAGAHPPAATGGTEPAAADQVGDEFPEIDDAIDVEFAAELARADARSTARTTGA